MSLRQYISPAVAAQITDLSVSDVTDKLINQAESMIDAYCAEFYVRSFRRANSELKGYQADKTSFTETSLTLVGEAHSDNHFQYTVIELLEGITKGLLIPVISSSNNVLSFNTVSGLTGQIACKIYQLGKFPMFKDFVAGHKSIPREIIEATAYQVEFIKNNSKKFKKGSKKSESIGENYSYTLEDSNKDTLDRRIAPQAKDILLNSAYVTQTI